MLKTVKYVFYAFLLIRIIIAVFQAIPDYQAEQAEMKRYQEELHRAAEVYERNHPKENPYAPRSSTTYSSPATEPVTKARLTAEERKRLKKQLEEDNAREYDPADYDDPEEFADDAFGVDYDDWDEAEEAWYDY